MSTHEIDSILAPLRMDVARQIGEALVSFGYTNEALKAMVALGKEKGERELEPDSPVACLFRAFALHDPTPEAILREQLGSEFFDLCEEAGLWKRSVNGVIGLVDLIAQVGTYVISDAGDSRLSDIGLYWVMGLGASTQLVAHAVPAKRYERMLDLCCGSGVQSFLQAPFANEIVAVDRNPRALNFGRFGAAMNDISHVEFRESDCYSAVAGETFDAIVCNPPFVMSPDRKSYYRDGGMGGDAFAQKVLQEAPEYLQEGGFAVVVCDVASIGNLSSEERLCGWMENRGCDLFAIGERSMDGAEYAKQWLKPDDETTRAQQEALWVEQFRELDVTGIRNWLVVLRKRTGGAKNWVVLERYPSDVEGHFGAQIYRRFLCQDVVRMDDEEIWDVRLRLAPDARIHKKVRPGNGRWVTEEAQMTFASGLMGQANVDPRTVDFLLFFDGVVTLEEVLHRVAAAMQGPVEKIRGGWLQYVRQLTSDGYLEPVSG